MAAFASSLDGLLRPKAQVHAVSCSGQPKLKPGLAASLVQIERMALQFLERDDRERFLVRRGEHHRWRDARIERLAPAARAKAPAIAGLASRGSPPPGCGVDRSLPRSAEKARNSAVMRAQMTCSPRSSGPVLQQPSR